MIDIHYKSFPAECQLEARVLMAVQEIQKIIVGIVPVTLELIFPAKATVGPGPFFPFFRALGAHVQVALLGDGQILGAEQRIQLVTEGTQVAVATA
jgi:hypothetical protein